MKKLLCTMLAVIMSVGIIIVPANADDIIVTKEMCQVHINDCITKKDTLHEVAEFLRANGFSDDCYSITAMQQEWADYNAKQEDWQFKFDKLIEQEKEIITPLITWTGRKLTRSAGRIQGPNGPETYYNLNMTGCVWWMRNHGYDAQRYPYWVRDDGCKMLGSYIMAAANLRHWPKGSIVESSLGWCIIVDTGYLSWSQLDIAVSWNRRKVKSK